MSTPAPFWMVLAIIGVALIAAAVNQTAGKWAIWALTILLIVFLLHFFKNGARV